MKNKLLTAVLMAVMATTGCATKSSTLSVNRTVTEHMTDIGIERQVLGGLSKVEGLTEDNHRIAIDAFRGELLLTGEVPNTVIKESVENMARSIREVKRVNNYLRVVHHPKSQSHSVHEGYLKTKFLGKLLASRSGIKSSQYRVTVRDDILYVMGTMTVSQANLVKQIATETEGIAGFVSLLTVLASNQTELLEHTHDTSAGYSSQPATMTPVLESGQISPLSRQPQLQPQSQGQTQNPASSYVNLYQNTNQP